jgi:uncharacterized protein YqhQ
MSGIIGLLLVGAFPFYFGFKGLTILPIFFTSLFFTFENIRTGWRAENKNLLISFFYGYIFAIIASFLLYFLGYILSNFVFH